MPQGSVNLYDGLFLMNPQSFSGDLAGALAKIREILERYGAEVVSLRKWDERKLAYPVAGQKRGTFLLALFRVKGDAITRIERDCNLSDEVLRVLVTRGEHLGEQEINAEIQASQKTVDEVKVRGEDEEQRETVEAGAGEED